MRARCPRCGGEQELLSRPRRVLLHALPELRSPAEIVDPLACANCGCEVRTTFRYVSTDRPVRPPGTPENRPAAEMCTGLVRSINGRVAMFLQYPAVSVSAPGSNVLFPVHEGRLSGGLCIDRHGDPDLMAAFSAEYLKQYRAIVPKGRLPQSMVEMMPPLLLLLNAAELALKADLIRSEKLIVGHGLQDRYGELEDEHRDEVDRRFADAALNAPINALGADRPTVESVLRVYGQSFGSTVYMDTRYFAEPTTMLREPSLKGGNLVKDTPYPIFLPVVVQTMLDVYAFFSGAERLKRCGGADVSHGSRDPGNDQHAGSSGLVPASVGLVVIRVAQHVAWDEHHAGPRGIQQIQGDASARVRDVVRVRRTDASVLPRRQGSSPKTGRPSSTASSARSGTPEGLACTRATSICSRTPSKLQVVSLNSNGRLELAQFRTQVKAFAAAGAVSARSSPDRPAAAGWR